VNEHEKFREWLPLAAAGALEDSERRQLELHMAECPECAAELERWDLLAGSLKRLPTPRAPAALVQRVRAQMEAVAAARSERQIGQRAVVWLVLFSWTVTLASWPVVRLISQGMAAWLDIAFVHTWLWLLGFTGLSWFVAAIAAAMIAWRQRPARRML
jgi:anti-sigma factor RsiW